MRNFIDDSANAIRQTIESFWEPSDLKNWHKRMCEELIWLVELKRLAKIGEAVERMPINSSLKKTSGFDDDFAHGSFTWELERPGEGTTCGGDPLIVLTFHEIPEGGPPT